MTRPLYEEQHRRDEEREVLGRDTTACCVRHRRPVRWLPWPAWWIHDDSGPNLGHHGDPRGCPALVDAPSPLVIIRRADGVTVYPDSRELARRAGR